jgi:chromosome segregation ATPase
LAKELSDTQSPLDSEKDRELRSELSKRDERIAELTAATEASASELVKSTARIKEAEAEIAKAHAESRDAVARVSVAEAKVAEAQRGAAEASAKAESFRLDIARANERAAQANETAERERLARLQLEAQLAPRVLTTEQQQTIAAALRPLGRFSVQVFWYADTTEFPESPIQLHRHLVRRVGRWEEHTHKAASLSKALSLPSAATQGRTLEMLPLGLCLNLAGMRSPPLWMRDHLKKFLVH